MVKAPLAQWVVLWVAALIAAFSRVSIAEEPLRVAVASNFLVPMQALAKSYEEQSGSKVIISAGSSGKLYAQVVNNAPHDLFFSADAQKPARLEAAGHAVSGTRVTYAIGKLALVTNDALLKHGDLEDLGNCTNRVAIANPLTAPYGVAAREALSNANIWDSVQACVVRAENVAQAVQFVASGNAGAGVVAGSFRRELEAMGLHVRELPDSLYRPVIQQAIIVRTSETASDFMQFVVSPAGQAIVASYGYDTP